MLVRLGTCLLALTLAALPLSCTDMPEWVASGEGSVAVEELPHADAIPLEWGKLVSVTLLEQQYRFMLWFQDEAGNVRMVGYDFRANELLPKSRMFSRR